MKVSNSRDMESKKIQSVMCSSNYCSVTLGSPPALCLQETRINWSCSSSPRSSCRDCFQCCHDRCQHTERGEEGEIHQDVPVKTENSIQTEVVVVHLDSPLETVSTLDEADATIQTGANNIAADNINYHEDDLAPATVHIHISDTTATSHSSLHSEPEVAEISNNVQNVSYRQESTEDANNSEMKNKYYRHKYRRNTQRKKLFHHN